MSEPFIAEVRMLATNFAPRGWAFCDGQLLPISQNSALFALVGTTYGGDGRTTMALPNLQGRMPMHPGHGAGLSARTLGQSIGTPEVALTESEIPSHTHGVGVDNAVANQINPSANDLAGGHSLYSNQPGTGVTAPVVPSDGNGLGHENQSPYLNVNFTIALVGLFPQRS